MTIRAKQVHVPGLLNTDLSNARLPVNLPANRSTPSSINLLTCRLGIDFPRDIPCISAKVNRTKSKSLI